MAGPEVTAALKLRDEMSPALSTAGKNVGGFTSIIRTATGTMLGFLGAEVVGNIKNFVSGSVAAREESDRLLAQTAAVIKSTGGVAHVTAENVDELAQAISKYSGVDDEAVANGENLLLTFTNIRNAAGKGNDIFNRTTKIMVDMSKALGTDAAGSAIQLGKALNDPIKGITALTRVGVTFSDKQKEQIANFMKHNDIISAQKVILAELTREFGDSAKAYGDSSAGMMDKMKVAVGNAQEALGGLILILVGQFAPAIVTVADAIGDWLQSHSMLVTRVAELVRLGLATFLGVVRDVVKDLVDKLRPLAPLIGDVRDALTGKLLEAFQWFVDHKDTIAVGLITFAATVATLSTGGKILQLAGQLQTLAQGFLAVAESEGLMAAIGGLVGGPIGLIALAVAAAATAVYLLYQNVPAVRDALNSLGSWIMTEGAAAFAFLQQVWQDLQPVLAAAGDAIGGVLAELAPAFDDLMGAVGELWGQMQILWDTVVTDLEPALVDLWNALKPLAEEFMVNLLPILQQTWPVVQFLGRVLLILAENAIHTLAFIVRLAAGAVELATTLAHLVDQAIKTAIGLQTSLAKFLTSLVETFKTTIKQVWQVGRDIVAGIWSGIMEKWDGFIRQLTTLVSHLPDPIKKALGISSPSKVMEQVGKNYVLGLQRGIERNWPAVNRTVAGLTVPIPSSVLSPSYGAAGGSKTEFHLHVDEGAYIDGVGTDELFNTAVKRFRFAPGT